MSLLVHVKHAIADDYIARVSSFTCKSHDKFWLERLAEYQEMQNLFRHVDHAAKVVHVSFFTNAFAFNVIGALLVILGWKAQRYESALVGATLCIVFAAMAGSMVTKMAGTTTKCSGNTTWSATPTVMSAAIKAFWNKTDMSQTEMMYYNQFISYVKAANVGYHVFIDINPEVYFKAGVVGSAFYYVICQLLKEVS